MIFGGPISPTEDVEWPDTGLDSPCCMGSALDGPGSCTCWEPVYNLDQQPIDQEAARMLDAEPRPVARKLMCADCDAEQDGTSSRRAGNQSRSC
jgi:hypothetical protein